MEAIILATSSACAVGLDTGFWLYTSSASVIRRNGCMMRCTSFPQRSTGPPAATAFLGPTKSEDMQTGHLPATSKRAWMNNDDPCRPAGYQRAVTAETVTEHCQEGQLAEAVEALGILVQTDCRVPASLFYTTLKSCGFKKDLVLGRRVHALTVEHGYEADTFLCNHILRMYASYGRLEEAMDVFTAVAKPDAFMWSSIVSAHVNQGEARQAIHLYDRMRSSGVKPDGHVFVAALQACARGADLKAGQQVHADVLASAVKPDLFVCNALVDMYAKCGSLEEAHSVFDGLDRKDVVTWTALIGGYSQQGLGLKALQLYSAMQEEGVAAPNSVTFACLLQACASVGAQALETGKQLHDQILRRGFQGDVLVANSLVNMHAKCGSLEDAQRVFEGLAQKDVVTWNAMIAGYSQHGLGKEVLRLFQAMQQEDTIAPDSVTFLCLLQACVSVGFPALEKGKQLHAQIRERGLQADVFVANNLVNMYAKCGSLVDAQSLFNELSQKDVVTWNAMIAGYSQQGMGQEALRLYKAMQEEGTIAPDSVTFLCVLQACANVAALDVGRELHARIEQQGLLQSDLTLGNSLINMYAKSGSMVDAQQVFHALPERSVVTWNALIAGYTRQGNSDMVFHLFHRMSQHGIQPDAIAFLSVLTACSQAGLVEKGREYFDAMSTFHSITPTAEHYTCMVDLLGRAGKLEEALYLVSTMPVKPDAAVWHTLLGACRKWSNVEVGRHAFEEAVKLDSKDAEAYVSMSNIYMGASKWEEAQEIQARRIDIQAWKQPGQSWWTDMEGLVHSFLVADKKHPESGDIYAKLKQLFSKMEEEEYYMIEW